MVKWFKEWRKKRQEKKLAEQRKRVDAIIADVKANGTVRHRNPATDTKVFYSDDFGTSIGMASSNYSDEIRSSSSHHHSSGWHTDWSSSSSCSSDSSSCSSSDSGSSSSCSGD